jgi:hypothetical protein
LLKRTAKIETQAGAACKTEISCYKEVLPKAKKDLANAEAENAAAAMPTLPVPRSHTPINPITPSRY